MNKNNILLIFPKLGPYDNIIRDMPLSLIYASRLVRKQGFSLTVIDQRARRDWREEILRELKNKPVLAGISVMTGKPIGYALEISKFIKDNSNVTVVWGGIHPTLLPEQTIENSSIDILVKGKGETTLCELSLALSNSKGLSCIPGISYKQDNRVIHNQDRVSPDFFDFSLPDYDLVDYSDYSRFDSKENFFSILTSHGCPHRCGFCYNVSYGKRKWEPEPIDTVIKHLKFVMEKYHPTYFSVIDSDFFVDLGRVTALFEKIISLGWKVRFGFRGVRVDDMFRCSDKLFSLMEIAGVKHLHIGAESGSQRMLDLMCKDIKVEQTIEVNKRLKRFPSIKPTYNFFSGMPTETQEDIRITTDLILSLIKVNPNCLITAYNQFTPYPGTSLFDLAIKHGLIPPKKLEEWIEFDQAEFAKKSPWLSKKRKKLLDMLYFTTIFVDDKFLTLFSSRSIKYRLLRLCAILYRPIAKLRIKYHLVGLFFEGKIKPR